MAQAPVPQQPPVSKAPEAQPDVAIDPGDFSYEVAPDDQQPDYTYEAQQDDPGVPDNGIPSWFQMLHGAEEGAAALTVGALKGATNTVVGAADLARRYIPGVERLGDAVAGQKGGTQQAIQEMRGAVRPQGALEHVGNFAEQVSELLVPGPKGSGIGAVDNALAKTGAAITRVSPTAGRLAPKMAAESARAATQAELQGGDPETAAVIGAAAPVVGEAARRYAKPVATKLMETAEKRVNQALGPTKERFKAMADKIVPEIIKRGLGAGKSREALLQEATEQAVAVSKQLDGALQKYGTQQSNGITDVMDTLENAKNAFRRPRVVSVAQALKEGLLNAKQIIQTKTGGVRINLGANQRMLPNGMLEHMVEFDKRPIEQLDALKQIVKELGPKPTVDQLVALRRTWDGIVDGAGGYAHRAPGAIGTPLPEQAEAWAKMKGANAIRKLLAAEVPDLAAINKEYHFWRSLRDVLLQTTQRKLPQEGSLLSTIAGGAGAVVGTLTGSHYGGPGGAAAGGLMTAAAMAKLGAMFQKATTSPGWRMATAQVRAKLADAIMQNDVQAAATILGRIMAVQGSGNKATATQGPVPGGAAATPAGVITPYGYYEIPRRP